MDKVKNQIEEAEWNQIYNEVSKNIYNAKNMKNEIMVQRMIQEAIEARKRAYAPYSDYYVGACLLGESGELYLGCNIENASFSATNCAERTAFFNGVSSGEKKFTQIVIIGGSKNNVEDFCPPCGICLQVMMEFCDPKEFNIILAKTQDDYQTLLLKDLLPRGFGPGTLSGGKKRL